VEQVGQVGAADAVVGAEVGEDLVGLGLGNADGALAVHGGAAVDALGQQGEGAGQAGGVGAVGDGVGQRLPEDAAAGLRDRRGCGW